MNSQWAHAAAAWRTATAWLSLILDTERFLNPIDDIGTVLKWIQDGPVLGILTCVGSHEMTLRTGLPILCINVPGCEGTMCRQYAP